MTLLTTLLLLLLLLLLSLGCFQFIRKAEEGAVVVMRVMATL
jgi:hypothetical protein